LCFHTTISIDYFELIFSSFHVCFPSAIQNFAAAAAAAAAQSRSQWLTGA
jgi:hypothetical protein